VTVICAAVLLLLVASALAAPWLGLADPYKTSMLRRL
jgi:peptide/nickel transport system permease protein